MTIGSALERVLRYLKGTVNYGIHYVGHPRVLEGYSDTNWVSNADEILAQVDIMFTLGEQPMRFRQSIDTHERPGV